MTIVFKKSFGITILFLTTTIFLFSCNSNSNNTSQASDYKPIVKRLHTYGNWSEAIDIAKIQLKQKNLSAENQVFYLLALGQNYRFLEKYDLSEKHFQKVIQHPNSSNFPEYLGEALYGLGDLYYLKWSYFKEDEALSEAKTYLDSSMVYAQSEGFLSLQSKNLYRLGTILQIQGEKEVSMVNFKKGLEISFSISDTAGIIRNDTHRASVLERQGKFDSALFHYNRSYEFARNENRNYSEAHGLCNLGGFYFNQGNVDSAEMYFDRAAFVSEELNHGMVLCRSYYNLSRLQSFKKNKQLALTYFEKGLAIAKAKGYKNYEQAFVSLGETLNEKPE